jgi:hypothetical protein
MKITRNEKIYKKRTYSQSRIILRHSIKGESISPLCLIIVFDGENIGPKEGACTTRKCVVVHFRFH